MTNEAGTPLDPKVERRQRLWRRVQETCEARGKLVLRRPDLTIIDELFRERVVGGLYKAQAETFWKKLNEAATVYEETGDAVAALRVLGIAA